MPSIPPAAVRGPTVSLDTTQRPQARRDELPQGPTLRLLSSPAGGVGLGLPYALCCLALAGLGHSNSEVSIVDGYLPTRTGVCGRFAGVSAARSCSVVTIATDVMSTRG